MAEQKNNGGDIFGSTKTTHGAKSIVNFSGVLLKFEIKTEDSAGGDSDNQIHLCQSANLVYQRGTQQVYELGSEDVWTQIGPASGTLALSYIVSSVAEKDNATYLAQHAGCSEAGETISLAAGKPQCGGKLATAIQAKGCVLTQLGWQATAGQGALTVSAQYTVSAVYGGSGNGADTGAKKST